MKEVNGLALINKHRVSLMGLAAMLIFVYHECEAVLGFIPVVNFMENFIRRTGSCGVDIFFLLSGMGLTCSIEKNTLLKYYGKRLKRIALPTLIAGVIWALLCGWTFVDYIKNVTGFYFYVVNVNSFLWFIPAIVTIYLLFPLYYKCFSIADNKLFFTIGVIGVWLFYTLAFDGIMRIDLYGFTNRIPVFVFGVYLGDRSKDESVKIGLSGWFALIMTFVMGAILSFRTYAYNEYLLVPYSSCCVPYFMMASSGTIIAATLLEGLSKIKYVGKVVTGFLSVIGIVSLEFYSVQEPVGIVLRLFFPDLGHVLMNICILAVTLIIAYAIRELVKLLFWLFDKLPFFAKSKEASAE